MEELIEKLQEFIRDNAYRPIYDKEIELAQSLLDILTFKR
jgi:hypothetical protein